MDVAQLEFSPAMAGVYALSIYAFMFILSFFLLKLNLFSQTVTTTSGRYGSLDGLRGVLATSVFICHSFIAYGYFTKGQWQWTDSAIFNQLGQTSVALFFMITGFLFTLKALSPKVDWKKLYISRLARLGPLYAIIVCIVFVLVIFLSDGVLKESPWEIMKEFMIWITFVCFGNPDVNGYPMTWTLISGVNWSLKYEVIFYVFAVPVIHLVSRLISARTALFLALAILLALLIFRWNRSGHGGISLFSAQFLGGMIVAYLFKIEQFKVLLGHKTLRWFAVAATVSLTFMLYSYSLLAIISTIIIFAAVVGGASIFGLFESKAAIWLGDISYGIYLIHGLVLWTVLSILARTNILPQLGLLAYWLVILAVSVAVVLLASLSYIKLEKPIMAHLSSAFPQQG